MTFHTVKEVAEQLGVNHLHVGRLIKSGQLSAVDISQKPNSRRPTWRVTDAHIEEFVKKRSPLPAASSRRSADQSLPPGYQEFV